MATSFLQLPSISSLILLLLIVPILISPASSLVCTSQKFKGSAHYSNCTDLPTLNSFLHWSYDSTNSTLSIAFIASPAKPEGWVAWALNPTGEGMVGAQALLAYKASNGSMVVKTYNISSYSSIVESKLSFGVWDKKAESSNGVMRIFAKLALPAGLTSVNQVWQVGSTVTNGVPEKHEFQPANLNAKGKLDFVQAQNQISAAPAHAPSPGPGGGGGATGLSTGSHTGPSTGSHTGPGSAATRNGGLLLELNGFFLFFGILVLYGF